MNRDNRPPLTEEQKEHIRSMLSSESIVSSKRARTALSHESEEILREIRQRLPPFWRCDTASELDGR